MILTSTQHRHSTHCASIMRPACQIARHSPNDLVSYDSMYLFHEHLFREHLFHARWITVANKSDQRGPALHIMAERPACVTTPTNYLC